MESLIKKGYDLIHRRRKQWANEEEVRHAWMKGIEEALQIDLDAERARRDSSYNNVIIEFKGPGLFKGSVKSQKFIEATQDRLLKYISHLAIEQGIDAQDYIGIAIDGEHISFVQVQNGRIIHQPLMPFSITAFQMVIDALRSSFRRAITSGNLIEDFGHLSGTGRDFMQTLATGDSYGGDKQSGTGRDFMQTLADTLGKAERLKIKMLFEEWVTLYGQVADLSIQ